jgi:hypothetical protein
VQIQPIADGDIPTAAAFLHAHLNPRVSPATWADAIRAPWPGDSTNHGFMLYRGSELQGVLIAFYAEREIDGQRRRVCNLGAWCVLPEARLHSLRMLRTALGQEGFDVTDLSPSGSVVPLNRRLGFTELDTTAVLLPAVPLPPRPGYRVVTAPAQLETYLDASHRRIYEDHRRALAARHAVLLGPNGPCYVVYRRDRRKNLPVFATVLYVSDRLRFERYARRLASHLLRSGVLAVLVEERVGGRPRGSVSISMNRPKMVRSATVPPDRFDYLYSELVCVPW